MKVFRINEDWEVICESKGTRYGFKHQGYLMYAGNEVFRYKITYQNRTWERYQFENLLLSIIDKYLKEENRGYKKKIKGAKKEGRWDLVEYYQEQYEREKERLKPLMEYYNKIKPYYYEEVKLR